MSFCDLYKKVYCFIELFLEKNNHAPVSGRAELAIVEINAIANKLGLINLITTPSLFDLCMGGHLNIIKYYIETKNIAFTELQFLEGFYNARLFEHPDVIEYMVEKGREKFNWSFVLKQTETQKYILNTCTNETCTYGKRSEINKINARNLKFKIRDGGDFKIAFITLPKLEVKINKRLPYDLTPDSFNNNKPGDLSTYAHDFGETTTFVINIPNVVEFKMYRSEYFAPLH